LAIALVASQAVGSCPLGSCPVGGYRDTGRNYVGHIRDAFPHFFRQLGYNMPCPPTCFSLGFLFENVSKTKVTSVTFCVKSFSYYDATHSQVDVERV